MTASANRLLALEYLNALEAGDLDSALALTNDDAVFWLPGLGEMNKARFAEFFGNVLPAIRTMQFTVRGITEDGSRVAIEADGKANLANGRIYTNQYHFLFVVRGGLLQQIREFADSAPAAAAFGP